MRRNSGSKELNFLRDARKSFAKMIGTGKKSGVSSNYEIILFSSVSVPISFQFLFGYVARCLTKSLSEVSLVDVAHLYFTLRLLIHLQYVNHNLNFIKILRKFAYENIGKESHTLPSLTVWQLNYMLIVG